MRCSCVGARLGVGYTPLSLSRSWVKCEMGDLIDPRTMLFFQSRGSRNSFIHEEHVMSLPLGAFVLDAVHIFFLECIWTYVFIIAANMSTAPSKTWRIFALLVRVDMWVWTTIPIKGPRKNASSEVLSCTVLSLFCLGFLTDNIFVLFLSEMVCGHFGSCIKCMDS